jgi:hypothetical protein
MVDTIRTISELQTLLADNTVGDISAQHMRDLLVSVSNMYEEMYTVGWEDMVAPMSAVKLAGVSDPSFTLFQPTGTGGLRAYQFAKGDEVYFTFHTLHNVKPNSTAYFHVHWAVDSTSTGTCAWDFEWSLAKGHNQQSFPALTTRTISQAGSGTAFQHMVTEDTTGITIPEPDCMLIMRMERNNTATDNITGNVFGFQVDFHYQTDRNSTKNRTPNFYT